jgi:hypothetical protein
MKPQEIWADLCGLGGEEAFVRSFNDIESDTRREVAEYVLSEISVFSGKGAILSARYDSSSALLR